MKSIYFFSILLLLISLLSGFTSAGGKDKPNILFIYTDDQSTRAISACPGSYPWVNTPNIDALAQEGTLFLQALTIRLKYVNLHNTQSQN